MGASEDSEDSAEFDEDDMEEDEGLEDIRRVSQGRRYPIQDVDVPEL